MTRNECWSWQLSSHQHQYFRVLVFKDEDHFLAMLQLLEIPSKEAIIFQSWALHRFVDTFLRCSQRLESPHSFEGYDCFGEMFHRVLVIRNTSLFSLFVLGNTSSFLILFDWQEFLEGKKGFHLRVLARFGQYFGYWRLCSPFLLSLVLYCCYT